MAAPIPPALFVHPDDVAARFEGTFPDAALEQTGWVQLRIVDVESVLIGLVPSLVAGPITDNRTRIVKALVSEKVLEMHRNPQRAGRYRQDAEGISEEWGYLASGAGHQGVISFTEDELNMLRDKGRRGRFGTIPVAPWKLTQQL